MMLPNQIMNQRFSQAGKGGYRASEVDAFIQRVFQNYNKLYNDNNVLKERLSAITPLIDEYNENKRAIADALIWAKTTSDKSIEQAQTEAKEIIEAANAEGQRIIADKTAEAQSVYAQELSSTEKALENAKTDLEMTKNQAKSFSERYMAEINAKAASVIEEANSNASKIVADAYKDAQTARDKADSIIRKANEELEAIKSEAVRLKAEIERAVMHATESMAEITVDDLEPETVPDIEIIQPGQIDVSEIEEFTFDFEEVSLDEEDSDYGSNSENAENEAEESNSFDVETVIDDITFDIEEQKDYVAADDLISGGATAAMPDVSAYISKIFDSAGSEGTDFSSFADGLNDAFAQSLEDSDISFDELKKVIESSDGDDGFSDDE